MLQLIDHVSDLTSKTCNNTNYLKLLGLEYNILDNTILHVDKILI